MDEEEREVKKKIFSGLFLIVLIICIVFTEIVLFLSQISSAFDSKIQYKFFYSPTKKNKVTTLVEIIPNIGHSHYYKYIVDGIHKQIPKNAKRIEFSDNSNAGIFIIWDNDNVCNIYADKNPEINNLEGLSYKVNIIVDKEKIDELERKGKKIIRYSVEP